MCQNNRDNEFATITKITTANKILAVGDVHGTFLNFRSLIPDIEKHILENDKNIVVFLGDLIDRGVSSYTIVDYIIKLKNKYPENVVALRGNHEQLLIDAFSYEDYQTIRNFYSAGGITTIKSYLKNNTNISNQSSVSDIIGHEHILFYTNMPHILETNKFIFVHAGLSDCYTVENQYAEDTLWIREEFIYSNHYFGKPVIYGHTPIQNNRKKIPGGIVLNSENGTLNKLCLDGGVSKYRNGKIRTAILDDSSEDYIIKEY